MRKLLPSMHHVDPSQHPTPPSSKPRATAIVIIFPPIPREAFVKFSHLRPHLTTNQRRNKRNCRRVRRCHIPRRPTRIHVLQQITDASVDLQAQDSVPLSHTPP